MKKIIGATVASLAFVFASPAMAHPSTIEPFTTVVRIGAFPTAAPFRGTYAGTFTTSTGDSGTESVNAIFAAVPSPAVGDLQTLATLTSSDGHSTLVLRCEQLATAQDFFTYPSVPSTGSCAVLSASAAYADLSGSGPLNGAVVFDPSGTSGTLTDRISLGS